MSPHAPPRGGAPEAVSVAALERFLDARGLGCGPVAVRPIGEGRSNLTLDVERGPLALVLRRPPAGPRAAGTHDVLREARVIGALAPTDVPVPEVVAVCDDDEVLGAPFVLTTRIDGLVISAEMPPLFEQPESRRALSAAIVDALAAIHAVDPAGVGLADLGRSDGYLERQVDRHLKLWELYRTRELPVVEEIGGRLRRNMPAHRRAGLVHGDFRLGNVMFEPGLPPSIAAVLDWELSTLGDPLVDLGYLCACWTDHDEGERPWQPDPATRAAGCMDRAELVARYERSSGTEVEDIAWYEALALWRGVIFMEGNYRRARDGFVDDPYLIEFGSKIPLIAELAYQSTSELRR